MDGWMGMKDKKTILMVPADTETIADECFR